MNKKKISLLSLLLVLTLALVACSQPKDKAQDKELDLVEEEVEELKDEEVEEEKSEEEKPEEKLEEKPKEEASRIRYETKDGKLAISYSKDLENLVHVSDWRNGIGLTIEEKTNMEVYGGHVGSLGIMTDAEYIDAMEGPNIKSLKYNKALDEHLVLIRPSDVQFAYEDEEKRGNYERVEKNLDDIIASVEIKGWN